MFRTLLWYRTIESSESTSFLGPSPSSPELRLVEEGVGGGGGDPRNKVGKG